MSRGENSQLELKGEISSTFRERPPKEPNTHQGAYLIFTNKLKFLIDAISSFVADCTKKQCYNFGHILHVVLVIIWYFMTNHNTSNPKSKSKSILQPHVVKALSNLFGFLWKVNSKIEISLSWLNEINSNGQIKPSKKKKKRRSLLTVPNK